MITARNHAQRLSQPHVQHHYHHVAQKTINVLQNQAAEQLLYLNGAYG
jgi:hypothetical protein